MVTRAATPRVAGPAATGRASAGAAARVAGGRVSEAQAVRIRLLGEFEVLVADSRVGGARPGELVPVPATAWCRRPAMALVKLLALAPARRLHREVVLDALWPELPMDEAVPRLHKCAHYARRALGRADAVVLRGSVVALCPGWDVSVDAEVFRRAGTRVLAGLAGPGTGAGPGAGSATGSLSGRVVSLDRWVDRAAAACAADVYGGPLLPEDLYEPWTEPARDQLRLLYLRMLRAAGRWERLLLEDPADERAHLAIMRRHAARGERAAALRQFDRLAAVLRRELGVAPCEDAVSLRAAVLADFP